MTSIPPKKEAWIRFMAPVIPESATALFRAVDQKIQSGVQRLNIMISSPGGSVFHGLSIYNFLKGAPIEVATYNFGSVDSIGVVIFCSGDTRVSVPNARFLIHGVSMTVNAKARFDEKDLEEKIKSLRIDYYNIARVISATTGRAVDDIVKDMETRITLTPEEGKNYGLVQEIRAGLFPMGADLTVIHEDSSVGTPVPRQMPQRMPASVQNFTEPSIQGFTAPATENSTGIVNG